MKFSYLTSELIIGFIVLFIIIKIVGRRVINQVTPFTFITAIVLGELLGNALYDEKIGVKYILYSMFLWGFLLYFFEWLGQKSSMIRLFNEGKPIALIQDGIVSREGMKKARMNLNQLQSLLRQSETFSIREVQFCYLESNGSISILKKSPYQKLTQEDIKLPIQAVYVPVTIIRDGVVLWDELEDLGFDKQWLNNQLLAYSITHYRDVFLAEWLEGKGLYIQSYNQRA